MKSSKWPLDLKLTLAGLALTGFYLATPSGFYEAAPLVVPFLVGVIIALGIIIARSE